MKEILSKEEFVDSYTLKKFSDYAIKKYSLNFPIKANENLAAIVSFLTFDGHLTLKKSMFTFTAGSKKELNKWINLMYSEFGVKGKLKKVKTNPFGTSYEFRICNKPLCRILALIGVPTGDKVKQEFQVPGWIREHKLLSWIYLKTAFDCEGSIWKEPNRERARFTIYKEKSKLGNGMSFIDELKDMFKNFDISTTNTWIKKGNLRKDGKITVSVNFDIKAKDIERFKRIFSFC